MNIIEEIRAFREIVLGKQDKLIPGDHIILGDDDVISVDFAPVDALLDRLEEVEDDINALNFDVTELDIRLDAAEENIEDAQDHLDSVDYSINELNESLDALKTKVDNIHGFEIVALSEGQYDPETMKPTVENPKTNTLYLVPNDDPTQRNLWIEWLWISNRWEQFGTAVIDLSEYVKKTDTPTAILPGVVKVNKLNGVQLLSNGQLAITPANLGDIQSGQNEYLPIAPAQQHNAVFYGLARASRTPALYYNAVDKTNIRLMIDAGSHAQVENLANDVEGFGIKVDQLLNRTGETRPGMVWESKLNGAGWSEAAQGKVVDVTKDGVSLMDEYGIVELPDVDVPTKTSDLVNDSGFITESALPTKVSDLENDSGFLVSADLVSYALRSEIPTKVSDLQNDSGFLTEVPIASTSVVGGIKTSPTYGTENGISGVLHAKNATYSQYSDLTNGAFISKGTLENVLTGRGYPVDVKIDGTSIVDENKVANIPTAGPNTPGLVRVWGKDYRTGIKTSSMDGSSDILMTVPATQQRITQRVGGQVITPTVLDIAVKAALTDGIGPAYTATEQAAARARLGITAGEKEIFEATYGVTTHDEIAEAVEDGKTVVMKYNAYIYSLSVLSTAIATFNSLDAGKMRYAYIQPGETSVWHSGTDALQFDNLSQTIEGRETSTTNYPTTKAVVDYIGNAGFMPKSQLLDAGIKSISWSTNIEGTYTTVEDPLKAQRPSGTNTRYWVEMDSCPYFYHSKMYRVTFNGTVYDNLECRYGILVDNGQSPDVGGCWQMIGNRSLYDSRYIDTGEPFAILYVEHGGMSSTGEYYYSSTAGHGILLTASAETVTLKIETATITKTDLPHCLDEDFGGGDKLLETTNSTYPRSSWGQGNIVGRGSFAIGNSNISTGQFGVALGKNNIQECGLAFGMNNEVGSSDGQYGCAIGKNNISHGHNSIDIGSYNKNEGDYSTIIGDSNNSDKKNATIVGIQNKIINLNKNEQTPQTAIGYNNIIDNVVGHVCVIGDNNTPRNTNNFIFGINNQSLKNGNGSQLMFGCDNISSGYESSVIGYRNNATNSSSFVFGKDNIASGVRSIVLGTNLINARYGGIVLGKFNKLDDYRGSANSNFITITASGSLTSYFPVGLIINSITSVTIDGIVEPSNMYQLRDYYDSYGYYGIALASRPASGTPITVEYVGYGGSTYGKHLLQIGNGTADNARSNAHTLDWNGLGWFKGGLKVGGTGQDDSNAENVVLESDLSNYALESDLEALEDKVDALHGFEIVFLTTGEYDPTTGIPTILGPQEGTLYLVPSGQASPDVWTEWLWTGEAWEKFGSSSIDLSNYVQKTDYATSTVGGVIIADANYGAKMTSNGKISAVECTYEIYQQANNNLIIGKGTLENILTGRGYLTEVPTATGNNVGGFKTSSTFGTGVSQSNGKLYATVVNYSDYDTSDTNMFISKGTLENVLNGRGYPVDIRVNGTSVVDGNKVANIPIPSISYDETEEMLVWQTTADDGNEVSY